MRCILSFRCKFGCDAVMHSCKSAEHSFICPVYEFEDEHEWMLRGTLGGISEKRAFKKGRKKKKVEVLKEAEGLLTGPGRPARETSKGKVGLRDNRL